MDFEMVQGKQAQAKSQPPISTADIHAAQPRVRMNFGFGFGFGFGFAFFFAFPRVMPPQTRRVLWSST